MMRLLAIARNAFVETVRQPIYTVLILATFAMLVGTLPLANWSMGRGASEYRETDQLNMIVWGLSTLLGSGLLIAAFSAASVLSREIEEKTILTVISKPVQRPIIVLGKFLGVTAALMVALYLCSLVFLMTVRHGVMSTAAIPFDWPVIVLGCSALGAAILTALACNYFFGWHYTSAGIVFKLIFLTAAMAVIGFVGKGWKIVPFGTELSADVLAAVGLILLGNVVFAAVAVAASTRLGQMLTLLVCVGFTVIGLWTHYLFGQFGRVSVVADLLYRVWPNMSFFLAMDTIMKGEPLPLGYAGLTAGYAACHVVAILAVGMILFQRRETEVEAGSAAPRLVTLLAWCGRIAAVAAAVLAVALGGNFDSLARIAVAVGVAAVAVGGWLVAGAFGRGAKWAYFLAFVGALAVGIAAPVLLYVPALAGIRQRVGWESVQTIAACAAGGVVLMTLVLGKTRYHFGFVPRRTRKSDSGSLLSGS